MSSPSIQNPYSAQDDVAVPAAAYQSEGIDIDNLVEEVEEVDQIVARSRLNDSRDGTSSNYQFFAPRRRNNVSSSFIDIGESPSPGGRKSKNDHSAMEIEGENLEYNQKL